MAQQRFYNATEKLLNAFLMGTIKHRQGCACAIGTLCNGNSAWFATLAEKYPHLYFSLSDDNPLTERELRVITGYPIRHIISIEKTFEKENPKDDPDGFKGLCNVFDYLISIEDWKEEEKGADIFELLEAINN